MRGFVLWEGRSRVDGVPLVAVAILHSDNRKTGDMVQTYILCRDVPPLVAVKTGQDVSICGNCPHRGLGGRKRSCYVEVGRGPRQVWEAYQQDKYPRLLYPEKLDLVKGRGLRWGTYGDPALLHLGDVINFSAWASTTTGYTRMWRKRWARPYQDYLMASVLSEKEGEVARSRGWRTFRTSPTGEPVKGEVICPASPEAGSRTTCLHCGLCRGAGPAKSVVIKVHGYGAKNFQEVTS